MGELGRVMEDSAREAIDLLTRLGGDEYDDGMFCFLGRESLPRLKSTFR
jgi:hypothetical protein